MDILVITPDGELRNSNLRSTVPSAKIIKGFDGRLAPLHYHNRICQDGNQVVIGRRLSSTQAGAVLSHYDAQARENHRWVCILEDDAIVLDGGAFYDALRLIDNLSSTKPTIVLLYAGYGGVYSRFQSLNSRFSIAKVRALPTGAVGYVINSSAQKIVSSQDQVTGGPDWPIWSVKVHFLQLFPSVVFHSEEFESIYMTIAGRFDSTTWPAHRSSFKAMITSLFRPDIINAYGGRMSYMKCVLLPAIHRRRNHHRSRTVLSPNNN